MTQPLQVCCVTCWDMTLEPLLKLDPNKCAIHYTLSPLDQQCQCIDTISLLLFD